MSLYVIEGVNPIPWTAPTASVGRKGKGTFVRFHSPASLTHYKRSVREELMTHYSPVVPTPHPVILVIHLWRQLDATHDGKHRAHAADATNLQKALEDALQPAKPKEEVDWPGLFLNDNQVMSITTVVVEQGKHTKPLICIEMKDIPSLIDVTRRAGNAYIKEKVIPILEKRESRSSSQILKSPRIIEPGDVLF